MVVTWGVSHGDAHLLLPMSLETLKSLTVELLIAGSSVNTIKNVWRAIEDSHRMPGHVLPLAKPMLLSRMVKALASVRGSPGRLIFPISAEHVQELLRMTGLSVNQTRWMLVICLGTVLPRVGELAGLQICNFTWGLDQAFGPEYAEGAGVRSPPGIIAGAPAQMDPGTGPGGQPLLHGQGEPGGSLPLLPATLPEDSADSSKAGSECSRLQSEVIGNSSDSEHGGQEAGREATLV